jgi:hypothetical protein
MQWKKNTIMDSKQVEILLEKYWDGSSSINEEKQLEDFFSFGDVPSHLIQYRELFISPELELRPSLGRDFDQKILDKIVGKKSSDRFNILKIAAIGLILIISTISVFQMDSKKTLAEDTSATPEAALVETKKAFLLIAQAMNKSEQQVMVLSKLDESSNNRKKNK